MKTIDEVVSIVAGEDFKAGHTTFRYKRGCDDEWLVNLGYTHAVLRKFPVKRGTKNGPTVEGWEAEIPFQKIWYGPIFSKHWLGYGKTRNAAVKDALTKASITVARWNA